MFMSARVLRCVVFKLANVPLNMPVSSSSLACHDVRVANGRSYASDSSTGKHRRSEEDFGLNDVDAQIEAVIREEKKKAKNIKFQKIQRQLRTKGAPERKLTWEAIQQIRFLKQESPEEWSTQRLAEGFSVTPDEISRILRSKFNPSPERKRKQDTMVLAKQQQPSLADRTKVQPSLLPRSGGTQAALPPGATGGATGALVVAPQSQGMTKVDGKKVAQVVKSSTAISLASSKLSSTLSTTHVNRTVPTQHITHKDATVVSEKSVELEDKDEEEDYSEDNDEKIWDGVTFSDAELQDFAQTMTQKHTPLVQKGREYFDTKGNFLYRV